MCSTIILQSTGWDALIVHPRTVRQIIVILSKVIRRVIGVNAPAVIRLLLRSTLPVHRGLLMLHIIGTLARFAPINYRQRSIAIAPHGLTTELIIGTNVPPVLISKARLSTLSNCPVVLTLAQPAAIRQQESPERKQ